MRILYFIKGCLCVVLFACNSYTNELQVKCKQPIIPVLTHKTHSPVLQIYLIRNNSATYKLEKVVLSTVGSTNRDDIREVSLFLGDQKGNFSEELLVGSSTKEEKNITFNPVIEVSQDTLVLWVAVRLNEVVEMTNRISVSCKEIKTTLGAIQIPQSRGQPGLRVGIALCQQGQNEIEAFRIPGLTTTPKGTLIAIYDARREKSRDLQGDIDIASNCSTDGGKTWSPMQVVLDMGTWGGLPERYNGVSDACVLSDDNTGDLYVFALWMHGILDSETGKWVQNLTDTSTVWNHQWRSFGSQPGFDVKQTSQFMMTKSTDDGKTWCEPVNITCKVKKNEWWLMAPAPGRGITLTDGTLVIPVEGRDKTGLQFSTIAWSKDRGSSWNTGTPAYTNTNECAVVELSDHSLMLNMRERGNSGRMEGNGRAIAITKDLGETWTEHSTSRNALIEPACMGSLHRHFYTENGERKSVLFFLNPSSKTSRNTFTIKTSFDDGNTWPEKNWLLIDEYNGRGYSCITSIDEQTIGILHEGSQADMVFQQIAIKELIKK